ncbi:MAG: hypothetical protein NTW10_08470 [Bacteroidetes bacterium]|nr:hypothetical protein [Bacteroidota bacterium]
MANGQTSTYEAYEAAKIAKEANDHANESIYHLRIPDELPDTIKTQLQKSVSDISTAYYMRMKAYEAAMEFLDNNKPSYLDNFNENWQGADIFIKSGVMHYMAVKVSLGILNQKKKKQR